MENQLTTNKEAIMVMAKNWLPPQKTKSGRKSKLNPYLDTIRYMRSARHLSYKDIHSFIVDTGTNVTYQSLMNFVKKNMKRRK
jgi:CO dehydrogenase/acetyl-CoA synthase alpha subunit